MAFKERSPCLFLASFRRWFKASSGQDIGDGGTTDLDLQPAKSIANFGVPPSQIFVGQAKDKIVNLIRLSRSPHAAGARAVVFAGSELPIPRENGFRANDLTGGLAFFGR